MNKILKIFPKKGLWIAAALALVILRLCLPSAVIEQYYSRGLFLYVRKIADHTVGLLPFPSVYLLFLFLVFYIGKGIFQLVQSEQARKQKMLNVLWNTLHFLSLAIFFFLALWGFNYGREPIEKQLNFKPQALEYQELLAELEIVTKELATARQMIPQSNDSVLTADLLPSDAENLVRADLTKWLDKQGFPTPGRVRGRLLYPKGLLLRISTAGVYLPWVAEGHIDPGMYAIQIPFVMAHEMSHAYGFTDEGTCNFIAYQSLKESKNPFFKYSGIMGYWVYLASSALAYNKETYKEFYDNLPEGIKNDRRVIRAYSNRYPDFMPQLRDAFYNQYLKTQGIEEGMKNYSRVIMLAKAWRDKTTQGLYRH